MYYKKKEKRRRTRRINKQQGCKLQYQGRSINAWHIGNPSARVGKGNKWFDDHW